MNERDRQEFAEFAAARSGALIRLAYVLAADQHAAEDLLQVPAPLARPARHLERRMLLSR